MIIHNNRLTENMEARHCLSLPLPQKPEVLRTPSPLLGSPSLKPVRREVQPLGLCL